MYIIIYFFFFFFENIEIVEFLIENGADIGLRGTRIPIITAVEVGNLETVKLFVILGVLCTPRNGSAPLDFWSLRGPQNGVKINAHLAYDLPPIQRAIYSKEIEIINFFIDIGADLNSRDDFFKNNTLEVKHDEHCSRAYRSLFFLDFVTFV